MPLTDLFKFIKDVWDVGSSILDVLKINDITGLIEKVNENLATDIKEKLKDLIGTDKWFEAAMNAAVANGSLPLGFDKVRPTKNQIDAAVGRTDYITISIDFLGVKSWDVDKSMPGAYFIHGCEQNWKVVVEYEE